MGVDLEGRSLEMGTLFEDMNRGNFELYSYDGSAETTIPISSNGLRLAPHAAQRRESRPLRKARLDELVDQARIEPNQDRRRRSSPRCEQIVAEDCRT